MRDSRRFDPLGWLLSASLTVLAAAGALALAVCIISGIWPWLLLGAFVSLALVIVVRLVVRWQRSQPW